MEQNKEETIRVGRIPKSQEEIEKQNEEILKWSEGNEHLQRLLQNCRENNVPSMFCCAGHGKGKPAYITVRMNEETIGKVYSIMSNMADMKDIGFRFAQKEFGRDPSFTVYMNNEREKNNIMDIISKAMSQEQQMDSLPNNFKMLIQISKIFIQNEVGFDLEYGMGRNNKLILENLKFGNSQYIEQSDFKQMGLRLKRDIVRQ